ncbi:SprT family zinc-dependent metalloprotease [Dehalogenimonas sp. THU2]|uniref:M48 family metallopeptidase n=1 Tax=Dehalogenimonas sp. THU2 TaxID=3151121 RepID=UPI0032184BB9
MDYKNSFLLIRSSRRTLALEVKPDASLVVRAPRRTPVDEVHRFIAKHSEWIDRKQMVALERPRPSVKSFVEGEEFLFLGSMCRLCLVDTASCDVDYDGRSLILATAAFPRAREMMIGWYKKQARKVFSERIDHYAPVMECFPSIIRITSPARRWGSCGAGGSINLNWKLIMAPLEVIDYLIVHELAHIRHRGHSREFWDFVKAFCPGYTRYQLWLKDHGHLLEI